MGLKHRCSPRVPMGQAMLAMVILLTFVSALLTSQASIPAKADLALSRKLLASKQASFLSESGLEDASYRIRKAWDYDLTEILKINSYTATTSVLTNYNTGDKTLVTSSSVEELVRSQSVVLSKNDRVSFNYGVQAGEGGFSLANSSSVLGNIYSNGRVSGSGNLIQGSVVSSGPSGLITGIHATSSVWAHTIQNSTIDVDAHYQTLNNTTVGGSMYPGSPDKVPSTSPLPDSKIEEWKQIAADGGVISGPCPYRIMSNVSLGPKKINCDLEISNNPIVTISGTIWVLGNITFKNSSSVRLASSLGPNSVALIADNPSNRLSSSAISIQNSTIFQNSGTPGSYLFLISKNNNTGESGVATYAIDLANSAQGDVVLYAKDGRISIGNSSRLRSVTGWQISLKNSAQLLYDDGLENSVFDTGPGGSWSVSNWKEVE